MHKYPTISDDQDVQALYVECRQQGTSHNLAEMFALKRAPHLDTDTTFLKGIKPLGDQFTNDNECKRVIKEAKKLGYTPRTSDYYCPGIANKCGDPAAFVPHANPKAHIRKVCEERDTSCHGAVEVKRKAR